MKTCTKCKEMKPLTEFCNRKANKDGKHSSCKKCESKQQKKYYLNNKERISEMRKKYYLNNKDKVAERGKKYKAANKEKVAKRYKKYRLNNPEKIKAAKKAWKTNNKEKVIENSKKWRTENSERKKATDKAWKLRNPEKCKEKNRRHIAKRRRNLGFIPVNKKKIGSVGHHIDNEFVIYIPEELHKSVSHAQSNIESMKEINILAIQVAYI